MLPYIAAMGIGLILGGLIGALISRLLLGRRYQHGDPSPARIRAGGKRTGPETSPRRA